MLPLGLSNLIAVSLQCVMAMAIIHLTISMTSDDEDQKDYNRVILDDDPDGD